MLWTYGGETTMKGGLPGTQSLGVVFSRHNAQSLAPGIALLSPHC